MDLANAASPGSKKPWLNKNGTGSSTSRDILRDFIRKMPRDKVMKILAPFKAGILHEQTLLQIDITDYSLDHVIVPITVEEFLEDAGQTWKKWFHGMSTIIDMVEATTNIISTGSVQVTNHQINSIERYETMGDSDSVDLPPTDFIKEFIYKMPQPKKRLLLQGAQYGLITEYSLINIPNVSGSSNVEVNLRKVLDIIKEEQKVVVTNEKEEHWLASLFFASHYSSTDFMNSKQLECELRKIKIARQSMSFWYSILFTFMTLATFASHIWSTVTNFEDMQVLMGVGITTFILIVSSGLIASLIYLVSYMVAFMFCTETSLKTKGLSDHIPVNPSKTFIYFSELHYFKLRIKITKIIQFILIWYTIGLSIFAHINELNIYPALVCVISNGFGLTLFARISYFFRACRMSKNQIILHAR